MVLKETSYRAHIRHINHLELEAHVLLAALLTAVKSVLSSSSNPGYDAMHLFSFNHTESLIIYQNLQLHPVPSSETHSSLRSKFGHILTVTREVLGLYMSALLARQLLDRQSARSRTVHFSILCTNKASRLSCNIITINYVADFNFTWISYLENNMYCQQNRYQNRLF